MTCHDEQASCQPSTGLISAYWRDIRVQSVEKSHQHSAAGAWRVQAGASASEMHRDRAPGVRLISMRGLKALVVRLAGASQHASICKTMDIPLSGAARRLSAPFATASTSIAQPSRLGWSNRPALLHKSKGRRDDPHPRRSYATGTVVGRPSCVKRLSKAARTCNSTT